MSQNNTTKMPNNLCQLCKSYKHTTLTASCKLCSEEIETVCTDCSYNSICDSCFGIDESCQNIGNDKNIYFNSEIFSKLEDDEVFSDDENVYGAGLILNSHDNICNIDLLADQREIIDEQTHDTEFYLVESENISLEFNENKINSSDGFDEIKLNINEKSYKTNKGDDKFIDNENKSQVKFALSDNKNIDINNDNSKFCADMMNQCFTKLDCEVEDKKVSQFCELECKTEFSEKGLINQCDNKNRVTEENLETYKSGYKIDHIKIEVEKELCEQIFNIDVNEEKISSNKPEIIIQVESNGIKLKANNVSKDENNTESQIMTKKKSSEINFHVEIKNDHHTETKNENATEIMSKGLSNIKTFEMETVDNFETEMRNLGNLNKVVFSTEIIEDHDDYENIVNDNSEENLQQNTKYDILEMTDSEFMQELEHAYNKTELDAARNKQIILEESKEFLHNTVNDSQDLSEISENLTLENKKICNKSPLEPDLIQNDDKNKKFRETGENKSNTNCNFRNKMSTRINVQYSPKIEYRETDFIVNIADIDQLTGSVSRNKLEEEKTHHPIILEKKSISNEMSIEVGTKDAKTDIKIKNVNNLIEFYESLRDKKNK